MKSTFKTCILYLQFQSTSGSMHFCCKRLNLATVNSVLTNNLISDTFTSSFHFCYDVTVTIMENKAVIGTWGTIIFKTYFKYGKTYFFNKPLLSQSNQYNETTLLDGLFYKYFIQQSRRSSGLKHIWICNKTTGVLFFHIRLPLCLFSFVCRWFWMWAVVLVFCLFLQPRQGRPECML